MYQIQFSKSAEKEIEKLSAIIVEKVVIAIQSLSQNPRPIGYKKLKGFKDLYRIRIGDYRVIYRIEDDILIIEVLKVGHRRYVYN
jgi:mRNA interferase RelE/StbE